MRECSILVVEDDASLRKSMGLVLTATGYRVRTAEDGFAALREIRCELPDILLSDLNMPGMTGFELLSVVRRRFPSVLVVAMSGTIADAFAGIAADVFHQKGGNIPSLLMKLEKLAVSRGTGEVRNRTGTPLWISTITSQTAGRSGVTLTCPECLRTFPHFFEDGGQLIQDAICIHCASLVVYAVVQHSAAETLPFRGLSLVDTAQGSEPMLF